LKCHEKIKYHPIGKPCSLLSSLLFTAVYAKDHEMRAGSFSFRWAEMEGGGKAWLANPYFLFLLFYFW
jgi:hypothetical protein